MSNKILVLIGYKTLNYGSALQAYATAEMLKKINMAPEILNLDALWKEFRRRKARFYLISGDILFLLRSKGGKYLSRLTELFSPVYRQQMNARREKFHMFLEQTLTFSRYVADFEDAGRLSEYYRYVLLGSDQVWLPSSVVTDVYTLGFVRKEIVKIAYAPSFGIDIIPEKYWNKYREVFSNIDFISLREDRGCQIVHEISGRKCPITADPVLMLNQEDWRKLVEPMVTLKEKYLFCYLIGDNRWQREWIRQYAKQCGIKTVALIHLDEKIGYDEHYFDVTLVDISPKDFLNWIRNAETVFTDSLHCMLFSLIEHKDFWCFRRFNDGKSISTNSRLYSILERIGLSNRLLSKDSKFSEISSAGAIEYAWVEQVIDEFRESSYGFLKDSLSGILC